MFKKFLKLVFSIFLCQAAGLIGSLSTITGDGSWYQLLEKPSFNPPNYLFGPVWITLYTLMGISFYLIWEQGIDYKKVRAALWIFGAQLSLNALWSILFFGFQNPFWGLIDILFLLVLILLTITKFWEINRIASLLLWPYFLWVSFATLLNLSIWMLN